jgi:hypothetical protein
VSLGITAHAVTLADSGAQLNARDMADSMEKTTSGNDVQGGRFSACVVHESVLVHRRRTHLCTPAVQVGTVGMVNGGSRMWGGHWTAAQPACDQTANGPIILRQCNSWLSALLTLVTEQARSRRGIT